MRITHHLPRLLFCLWADLPRLIILPNICANAQAKKRAQRLTLWEFRRDVPGPLGNSLGVNFFCFPKFGNGDGKQGRSNQTPYRRYGPDTEIQYRPGSHTHLPNPAELSPKGKPIWDFSIDPTSLIRSRLRTPFYGRHFQDFDKLLRFLAFCPP